MPLFSIPSLQSWGIGEIGDIGQMAGWLRGTGQRLLQLLPINEMPPGESSPYSALSAMAIDPQFISIGRMADFDALGGELGLEPALRERLAGVRSAPSIQYRAVRELKDTVMRRAFTHFRTAEWESDTPRAQALREYIAAEAWWLDDYALFRAVHAEQLERAWTDWPEPLRTRQPAALADARIALAEDLLFRQYLQWVASDQWAEARAQAGDVALFGDLPFMVSGDSADVWARQDQFRLDASVGVPPDAFSETGQDWGLPAYCWDVMASRDFEWLRARARRNADLFDGYRIDHLVGFYRTYVRPHAGGEAEFTPVSEAQQRVLGERVLGVFREPGATIIAEDLGTVPDFVRESLTRLSIPGYKVFRWEREWDTIGQPFRDPRSYPSLAVATSGTHDTEPMRIWWEEAPRDEREAVLAIPSIRERLSAEDLRAALEDDDLAPVVHEALLEVLYASGADLVIVPIQDLFGWRDRINQPATVGDTNWTWRLPLPVERLATGDGAIALGTRLREWTTRHER